MPDHMRSTYLDFEKPVAELDSKVDELRALAATGSDIGEEISRIEEKGGAYECPVCRAEHSEQLDAVNCCFVEDRWLLEGRKIGLV